jgi:hypothetical protein
MKHLITSKHLVLSMATCLSIGCGPGVDDSSTPSPSVSPEPPKPFVLELDGVDYGAANMSASLTSSGTGHLLVIRGARENDPRIADDGSSVSAHFLIDNLAGRVAGDQIEIDAVTSFVRSEHEFVVLPEDITTVGSGDHDSNVRRAFVRKNCFCSKANWHDQVLQGTLTLTTVAPDRLAGTIELTTSGGLPFHGFSAIGVADPHTSHFSGDFDTQSTP